MTWTRTIRPAATNRRAQRQPAFSIDEVRIYDEPVVAAPFPNAVRCRLKNRAGFEIGLNRCGGVRRIRAWSLGSVAPCLHAGRCRPEKRAAFEIALSRSARPGIESLAQVDSPLGLISFPRLLSGSLGPPKPSVSDVKYEALLYLNAVRCRLKNRIAFEIARRWSACPGIESRAQVDSVRGLISFPRLLSGPLALSKPSVSNVKYGARAGVPHRNAGRCRLKIGAAFETALNGQAVAPSPDIRGCWLGKQAELEFARKPLARHEALRVARA